MGTRRASVDRLVSSCRSTCLRMDSDAEGSPLIPMDSDAEGSSVIPTGPQSGTGGEELGLVCVRSMKIHAYDVQSQLTV
jgi:hypothetical protein